MQIQMISNNYQAKSQGIQRNQKQNNPSFGASIIFQNSAEVRAMGDCLEQLKLHSSNSTEQNFLTRALGLFTRTLRNIAEHDLDPARHKLFDATTNVRVAGISFRTGKNPWINWLDSNNLKPVAEEIAYASSKPEDSSMVIRLLSGAEIKTPLNASAEEVAKIGERIQEAEIGLRENMLPTDSNRRYLEVIDGGQARQPIQNIDLYG